MFEDKEKELLKVIDENIKVIEEMARQLEDLKRRLGEQYSTQSRKQRGFYPLLLNEP